MSRPGRIVRAQGRGSKAGSGFVRLRKVFSQYLDLFRILEHFRCFFGLEVPREEAGRHNARGNERMHDR